MFSPEAATTGGLTHTALPIVGQPPALSTATLDLTLGLQRTRVFASAVSQLAARSICASGKKRHFSRPVGVKNIQSEKIEKEMKRVHLHLFKFNIPVCAECTHIIGGYMLPSAPPLRNNMRKSLPLESLASQLVPFSG